MTKEEEKLLDLYMHFLKEKADSANNLLQRAGLKAEQNYRHGQYLAFTEMISFTETLKRTL